MQLRTYNGALQNLTGLTILNVNIERPVVENMFITLTCGPLNAKTRVEIPTILKTRLTGFTSFEYKVVVDPDRGVSEIDNVNYRMPVKIQLKCRHKHGR